MNIAPKKGPEDLIKLLVENYREGNPLLEGALIFRGSRLPDQARSSFSQEEAHGSLLLQVAASYTQNWQEKDAFIGAYPIDREKTRFYADYSMETEQKGGAVKSYSVPEVERALHALVSNIAEAPNSKSWEKAAGALEKFIKQSFYEAGVPTRTPEGDYNRPKDLYLYTGSPKAEIRQAVAAQMEKVTPANEHRAKAVLAREHRNEVGSAIIELSSRHPEATKAFAVLGQTVQRDREALIMAKHGEKPLNEFMAAVRAEPMTSNQTNIGKLAKVLGASLSTNDPGSRVKGVAVARQLGSLDPKTSTLKDVAREISSAAASTGKGTAASDRVSNVGPPRVAGTGSTQASRSMSR